MSDTLSETKACDLLSRLFRARGYTIVRNVLFREYGVEFHVDGWDEKARVGFEFLSSEDEDHIDLSLEEYQTLADAQRRGELALFIIDEVEPLTAADLAAEAEEFLDEAAAGRRMRRRPTNAAAKGGRKATRSAAVKPAAAKATKTASTKKAAAKKKAAVRKTSKATPKGGGAARSAGKPKAARGKKAVARKTRRSSR